MAKIIRARKPGSSPHSGICDGSGQGLMAGPVNISVGFGALECWSIGVLEYCDIREGETRKVNHKMIFHYSTTPLLQQGSA